MMFIIFLSNVENQYFFFLHVSILNKTFGLKKLDKNNADGTKKSVEIELEKLN